MGDGDTCRDGATRTTPSAIRSWSVQESVPRARAASTTTVPTPEAQKAGDDRRLKIEDPGERFPWVSVLEAGPRVPSHNRHAHGDGDQQTRELAGTENPRTGGNQRTQGLAGTENPRTEGDPANPRTGVVVVGKSTCDGSIEASAIFISDFVP